MITEFDKQIKEFEEKIDLDAYTKYPQLKEVKDLINSMYNGPAGNPTYLAWPGDLLQEAEFNLARLAESLSEAQAKADAKYSYAQGKYKEVLYSVRPDIKLEITASGGRMTRDEIDALAYTRTSKVKDRVDEYYAEYRILREVTDSIRRFLLALTHRINELQSEKRYTQ